MPAEETFTIRRAEPGELSVIVHHRRAMFEDMGYTDRAANDVMDARFRPWAAKKLASGEYLAWFAETTEGRIVAGAGMWIMEWPAGPIDASGRRAYIYNVYTEPAYRRRGLARLLVQTILEWCREAGIMTVGLHASDQGRSVYEAFGFKATNEMRLQLENTE